MSTFTQLVFFFLFTLTLHFLESTCWLLLFQYSCHRCC